MKKIIVLTMCIIMLASMVLCVSCSGSDESEVLENRVAECEITGFAPYHGEKEDMFLSEGDRIAVIAPSAIPSEEQVDATVQGLKEWGYEPVEGKHVREETRTLQDCYEDLKWALEDDSIRAIFCVRGGYAASEVMDITSQEMIAKANKLIIGYSDITVYHSAWNREGLPSIHASMSSAFTDLPEVCADAEKRMLRGELPSYKCESNEYCKEGTAEGILIGGNLTTIISDLNTAYDCTDTDQHYIIFMEAVEESMQRLHRFLTVMKHMGVLDKADGIIFGELTDVPADLTASDYDGNSRGGTFESAEDMICRQILADYDIPVAFGFPAGHGEMNYPLLFGEKVKLNVTKDSYTIEYQK